MTNINIAHNPSYKASLQDKLSLLSSSEDYLFNSGELENIINHYFKPDDYNNQQLVNFINCYLLTRSIKLVEQKELVLSTRLIFDCWFAEDFSLKINNYIAKFMATKLGSISQPDFDDPQETYEAEDFDEIAEEYFAYINDNERLLLYAVKDYLFNSGEVELVIDQEFDLDDPDHRLMRDLYMFIRQRVLNKMLNLVKHKNLPFIEDNLDCYFYNEGVYDAIYFYIEKFIVDKISKVGDLYTRLMYPQRFMAGIPEDFDEYAE